MSLSANRVYRIADVEVNTMQACVRRQGAELHLRHKTFQVLLYLIENRHRVVTRDELWESIWQSTAVTDDALTKCVADIRKALGDDAKQQRFLKTVSKSGYRFVGPVEVESLQPALSVVETEVTTFEFEIEEIANSPQTINVTNDLQRAPVARQLAPIRGFSRRRTLLVTTVGMVMILIAGYAGYRISRTTRSAPSELTPGLPLGRKSVAVMYLNNQSNTGELDWLREGLADMLINDLSRSKNLAVLNRQQLHFALERTGYKAGDEITLEQALEVGRHSHAAVIVHGSFARLAERIRVDLQLYGTDNGQLIATEHLVEDQPSQILTQIDLLSLKLAAQLGVTMADSDSKPGLASVMTNDLDAYRYYSLALEQTQMFQFDRAIELLEKALKLDPRFAMAHARIGYVYAVRIGSGEKARPHLEKALSLSDRLGEKDKLFIGAWLAQSLHDPDRTIEVYRDLLTRYPMETEAYQRLAWVLETQNRNEEALQVIRQGLITDSEWKDLYNALGTVGMKMGRNDEALPAFQRYIQLAPNDPNALDSLALFQQYVGRYEDAEASYDRALTLNPESGVAIIHLGHLRLRQGRYRAALEQYQRFIKLAKDDGIRARGFNCQAWVYLQLGDRERAAAAIKQELRYNPASTWNSLVLALSRNDSTAVARLSEPLFTQASYDLQKEKGGLRILEFQRGTVLLRQGRADEALEHLRSSLGQRSIEWNYDQFEDCLANAYLELGRTDEAIAEYERILKLNPNYPLVHYHLAQCYERRGQLEQAQNEYKEFLRIWSNADPDIPEIVHARARLNSIKAG